MLKIICNLFVSFHLINFEMVVRIIYAQYVHTSNHDQVRVSLCACTKSNCLISQQLLWPVSVVTDLSPNVESLTQRGENIEIIFHIMFCERNLLHRI